MSEADQLLAQQASQTANLMQAIGQNTQRAFENQFRVQASKMSTGLQVAGQIEQYRMNDAKLNELGQVMRIRDQEYQWEKANQAFAEKLRPLQFQAQQYDLQNKFRAQAEQRMSPFLTDIKGEFQQLIMDRPELAADAQSLYATSIDGVLNSTMSNPNADVAAMLQSKKEEMRSWMSKKKQSILQQGSQAILEGVDAVIGAATKGFDPTKKLRELQSATSLSKDESSRAASIYAGTFGGVPQDFLRKHDPIYRGKLDSSYNIMKMTGQITSSEDFSSLPIDQQEEILSTVKRRENISNLQNSIKLIETQRNNFLDANKEGQYSESIKAYDRQIGIMNKALIEELGIASTESQQGQNPEPEEVSVNEMLEKIKQAQGSSQYEKAPLDQARLRGEIPSDADIAESERRQAGLRPYAIIAALGGEKSAEKFKELLQNGNLNESEVKSLIDGASENQIQDLLSSPDAENIITTMTQAPASSYGNMNPYAIRKSDPYDSVAFAVKVLKSRGDQFTQSQKRESIKVLKSKLPSIILRYTQP